MVRCKVCNGEMPAKDRHASCIQCSRKKPCKHDRHEPVSYWDDVERLLKLAGLRSPRSSSRSQDKQSSGKSFKPAIQMPAPSSLFGNQSKPHANRSVSKDIMRLTMFCQFLRFKEMTEV